MPEAAEGDEMKPEDIEKLKDILEALNAAQNGMSEAEHSLALAVQRVLRERRIQEYQEQSARNPLR